MNARQKRLFEESLKKNPGMKMPTQAAARPGELTDEDMALLKQGVGDKTGRPAQAGQAPSEGASDVPAEQIGSIVTYFEEKGFGFLRPESGGLEP